MPRRVVLLENELPDDGYIDEIAVEIAARGDRRIKLTRPEMHAAIDKMVAQGLQLKEMATRIGTHATWVRKYLEGRGFTLSDQAGSHTGPVSIYPPGWERRESSETNLVQSKFTIRD